MTEPIITGAAVEPPQTASAAPEPDTALSDTDENDDDAQGGDDGKAAHLRKRAQDAEAARDLLADQLTRTRQTIVDQALTARGFDNERVRAAANVDVESLVDEETGLLDAGRLAAAIEEAAGDLGVKPPSRRPLPLPHVGRGGGDRPVPDGLQAFREAFGAN